MSYPMLRCKQGQLTKAQVNSGTLVVHPSGGRTLTVVDAYLRAIGGAVTAADGIDIVDTFLHQTADATTISATVPAVSEGESYALSVELIADHNTHTASTAYHQIATAAVTSTAATTEPTLIAQVNKIRTAMLAHYADARVHGGIADATRLALVAATTEATTAASAIVLENLLVAYHAAHITVTTALSTVFVNATDTGLAQNAILRAGAAETTATNLLASGAAGRGIRIVKNGADADTATAVDYGIFYVVT
jgi:hypothetical protein